MCGVHTQTTAHSTAERFRGGWEDLNSGSDLAKLGVKARAGQSAQGPTEARTHICVFRQICASLYMYMRFFLRILGEPQREGSRVPGVRLTQPSPLPETLQGKTLFPHVAFRNVSVQAHAVRERGENSRRVNCVGTLRS